ncbi:hypothetical protein [Streptomyces sp. NPDC059071]|uniref:hypothetical protein n=1 Tax=unclassified Streptomyces TaxID=2593676 RepID=UPI00365AC2B7
MPKRRRPRPNSRGNHSTSLSTPKAYRVITTWPHGARRTFNTNDRAQARAIARTNSDRGATVEFQEHQQWATYRTVRTYHPRTRS